MKKIRCAIYTRKSSEEGLEQNFNSLDAQREACAAYVMSQASEGWHLIPDEYDDGGISGGTLERPALKRLLSDIAAGKIDIVVVYKVDRLSRSLLDFSKLVEVFDKAVVSFVSVTQSFNTTNSMGRLTLNMLLSFAQFEREVTAERIRDKIAASKAKGMWMGGICPLGYRPDGRTLSVDPEHADIVRDLFNRYLELGSVRQLLNELDKTGMRVPIRSTKSGTTIGGGTFKRGQLYAMLANPIYVGEIHHKGNTYAGQHQPIVGRQIWAQVQQLLASNRQGEQRGQSVPKSSPLAGKIFDDAGAPLIATHACKGKQRYRYYVSKALHDGSSQHGIRMPAPPLEGAVTEELAKAFDEPLLIIGRAKLPMNAASFRKLGPACADAARRLRRGDLATLRDVLVKVEIKPGQIELIASTNAIASLLAIELGDDTPPQMHLQVCAELRRSGKVVRLVDPDRSTPLNPEPQAHLLRLLGQGSRWWNEMIRDGISVSEMGKRHGVDKSYVTRVIRANFIAPSIIQKVVDGSNPAGLDARRLLGQRDLPLSWERQKREMLAS